MIVFHLSEYTLQFSSSEFQLFPSYFPSSQNPPYMTSASTTTLQRLPPQRITRAYASHTSRLHGPYHKLLASHRRNTAVPHAASRLHVCSTLVRLLLPSGASPEPPRTGIRSYSGPRFFLLDGIEAIWRPAQTSLKSAITTLIEPTLA